MAEKVKPKGKNPQHQKFLEKVKELEDAGELNPTEADEKFERAMDSIARSQIGES